MLCATVIDSTTIRSSTSLFCTKYLSLDLGQTKGHTPKVGHTVILPVYQKWGMCKNNNQYSEVPGGMVRRK